MVTRSTRRAGLAMAMKRLALLVIVGGCSATPQTTPQVAKTEGKADQFRVKERFESRLASYPSCENNTVTDGLKSVIASEMMWQDINKITGKTDFSTQVGNGNERIDVADEARKAGCFTLADKMYHEIFDIYLGSGYNGLWVRAQSGLDKLEALKTKPN